MLQFSPSDWKKCLTFLFSLKKATCLCYGKTKMTERCFYCNPEVFYSFYRTMKLEMECDLMPEIPTDCLRARKGGTAFCKKISARLKASLQSC